ncbi:hypothetical protein WJX72_000044 [[Myrmecia] bisecta]|uniref:Uncharacterized protein n=1 Tax=[Myrmecia] bisecta TaxID=41462 RepID=A0AAW1P1G9_9CHLO
MALVDLVAQALAGTLAEPGPVLPAEEAKAALQERRLDNQVRPTPSLQLAATKASVQPGRVSHRDPLRAGRQRPGSRLPSQNDKPLHAPEGPGARRVLSRDVHTGTPRTWEQQAVRVAREAADKAVRDALMMAHRAEAAAEGRIKHAQQEAQEAINKIRANAASEVALLQQSALAEARQQVAEELEEACRDAANAEAEQHDLQAELAAMQRPQAIGAAAAALTAATAQSPALSAELSSPEAVGIGSELATRDKQKAPSGPQEPDHRAAPHEQLPSGGDTLGVESRQQSAVHLMNGILFSGLHEAEQLASPASSSSPCGSPQAQHGQHMYPRIPAVWNSPYTRPASPSSSQGPEGHQLKAAGRQPARGADMAAAKRVSLEDLGKLLASQGAVPPTDAFLERLRSEAQTDAGQQAGLRAPNLRQRRASSSSVSSSNRPSSPFARTSSTAPVSARAVARVQARLAGEDSSEASSRHQPVVRRPSWENLRSTSAILAGACHTASNRARARSVSPMTRTARVFAEY